MVKQDIEDRRDTSGIHSITSLDLRNPENYCVFRLFATFGCDRPEKVGFDL